MNLCSIWNGSRFAVKLGARLAQTEEVAEGVGRASDGTRPYSINDLKMKVRILEADAIFLPQRLPGFPSESSKGRKRVRMAMLGDRGHLQGTMMMGMRHDHDASWKAVADTESWDEEHRGATRWRMTPPCTHQPSNHQGTSHPKRADRQDHGYAQPGQPTHHETNAH